ncbi:hypothetical protein T484DRAFT_1800456 [Baffinella frigidus]|nr:hypothetical protein T484DRAFT_1800456 [Cryptophyta sp. CCMP2293]
MSTLAEWRNNPDTMRPMFHDEDFANFPTPLPHEYLNLQEYVPAAPFDSIDAASDSSAHGFATNTLYGTAQADATEALAQELALETFTDNQLMLDPAASALGVRRAKKENKRAVGAAPKNCKCPVCGKMFPQKANMEAHVNAVHLEIKHKCPICHKKLSSPTNLSHHMNQTHAPKGKHCAICNIDMRGDMNRHCRTKKHLRLAAAQAAPPL